MVFCQRCLMKQRKQRFPLILLRRIAEEITKIVANHSQVDWTNNKTIHDRISQDIDDLFYDYEKKRGLKLSFDTIDKIIENVKTVALRRF